MATSAFKSTSKRGTDTSSKKVPIRRRSLSVSAVSRTQLDIGSEFSNKRDNPLFWSSGSPPDKEIEAENGLGVPKLAENGIRVGGLNSKGSIIDSGDGGRGRSVARNADVLNKVSRNSNGSRKETGRSLSRVDTGRRHRSVSRGHYGASESEVELESTIGSNFRSRSNSIIVTNDVKKANLVRNVAAMGDRTERLRLQSRQRPSIETSDSYASSLPIPNWEDAVSTGSLSEAEEKTIKEVCEQMKSFHGDHLGGDTATSGIYETVQSEVRRAITDIQNDLESAFRRSNATPIATTKVADLPQDLVNPGAVELVLDIRREYAREFEESQERARKLRADLAVEEHREQELSRILKEIVPDPKATNVHKSRSGRKASSERKRMSKRLEEEAMTYFDECVSLSTFDSSDFSAPEDPSHNSVGTATPARGTAYLSHGSPSVSTSYCPNSPLLHNQELGVDSQRVHSPECSGLTANSTSNAPMGDQATLRGNNTDRSRKFQFSFAHKPTESVGFQEDIKSYIKNFEKEIDEVGINSEIVESNRYSVDEYNMQEHIQSLLFDKVLLKNRTDSGSLHLCGGGLVISFSPFASVI